MREVDLNPKNLKLRIEDLHISDPIGFIDSYGKKGYLVHIGKHRHVSAISISPANAAPNASYGDIDENLHSSVSGALNIDNRSMPSIERLYKFDDLKALHRWLGEE